MKPADQTERIITRLGYLVNSMVENGMDEAAEDYTQVGLFIHRHKDQFTAWLDTPDNAPEEDTACPACGGTEGHHFMGCPEDDPDDYEFVVDRELGV